MLLKMPEAGLLNIASRLEEVSEFFKVGHICVERSD